MGTNEAPNVNQVEARIRTKKGSKILIDIRLSAPKAEFELPEFLAKLGCFPTIEEYFRLGVVELKERLQKEADATVTKWKQTSKQ